jgi:hypothetical protein
MAQHTDTFDLDSYRWKHRVLIAFAPSAIDTGYTDLLQQVEDRKIDFLDRDMLLIRVLAEGISAAGRDSLSAEDAATLRERFAVSDSDSVVLLLGKDGGVKQRDDLPANLQEFFALIDTMPMRKREMRSRSRG